MRRLLLKPPFKKVSEGSRTPCYSDFTTSLVPGREFTSGAEGWLSGPGKSLLGHLYTPHVRSAPPRLTGPQSVPETLVFHPGIPSPPVAVGPLVTGNTFPPKPARALYVLGQTPSRGLSIPGPSRGFRRDCLRCATPRFYDSESVEISDLNP